MDSVTLYPGMATPLWVYGLQDSSSGAPVYTDSATVSVTLTDQNGGSLGPYTYTFQAGQQIAPDGTPYPDGNYRAIVPANAAIGASSLYLGTVSITIAGVAQTEYFQAASNRCAGRYSDVDFWKRYEGEINVGIFSDKDARGQTDYVSILSMILIADDLFEQFFTGFGYQIPMVFTTVGGVVPWFIKRAVAIIGMAELYFARRQYDSERPSDSASRVIHDKVERIWTELDEYRGSFRYLPCLRVTGTGTGTGVRAIAPTVNADGTRYIPRPAGSYGPYFNGQYWGW